MQGNIIQLLTFVVYCPLFQQNCNSANKYAWTNNNNLPCNDRKACTKNDRCSNGVCSGTPFSCLPCEECYNDACRVKPGYCVINEGGRRQCFRHGALRPGHQCQVKYLAAMKLLGRLTQNCTEKQHFNPLNPKYISIHIIHTVLSTFPKMLMRRICSTIKNFLIWCSFPPLS